MSHLQMLAIGDVVTDAFIKLLSAEAEIEHDAKKHPLLCMTYGTKIPYEEEIEVSGVGNAANAAVAASKLGLRVAFMSDVGSDDVGNKIIRSLHEHKVSSEFINIHKGLASNYHYVLWYPPDRTILIKHETYPYKWPEIRNYQKPEWIYLSSIAENGAPIHSGLAKYLENNQDVKFAFQPGTFQIREGHNKLTSLYKNCDIFAANKEEFAQILNINSTNEKELIAKMHKLGPKIVLLTDGPKGAYASDGNKIVFMPPYPDPKPPLDRTGAGDAYASTFTTAVAEGHSLEEALAWAGINSMSVVQKVGAQAGLLKLSGLKKYLAKAPLNYKARDVK